jgi:hypothetical protein
LVRVEPLGPKRAGVNLELRRFRRKLEGEIYVPFGFEHSPDERKVPGTDLAEYDRLERRPGTWVARELPHVYREARRILHRIGLPDDASAWCWRDPDGDWWAVAAPDDNLSPISVSTRRGAWPLPRGDQANERLPSEFLGALGGPAGPFAWAFFVVTQAARFRRLRDAARYDDSSDLDALAFEVGLEIGQRLAEYAVLDRVAASEAQRGGASSKKELRVFLREIAEREFAVRGPFMPHKFAAVLKAEARSTERGRRLAKLGAPGEDRLARLIIEEAEPVWLRRRL